MAFIVFFFGTLTALAHATLACLGVVCGLTVFMALLAVLLITALSSLVGAGQA